MTDVTTPDEVKETPAWDEANDPDGVTSEMLAAKDWVLDLLLDFVTGPESDQDGTIALTVNSGGVVISGLVVSSSEYQRRAADQLRDGGAGEAADAFERILTAARRSSTEESQRRQEAGLPTAARRFLHMRDTRVRSATEYIDTPLWRGNLSDISGWSFGSHNPKETADDK